MVCTRKAKIPPTISMEMTVGHLIDEITRIFPDREAIVVDNIRKTYKEYLEDIDRLSAGLLEIGIQQEDHCSIWAQNIYEWAIAWFALAKVGARLIPLDHWYKKDEVGFILDHAAVKTVICTSNYLPVLQELKEEGNDSLRTIIFMDDEIPEKDLPQDGLFKFHYISNFLKKPLTDEIRKKIKDRLDLTKPDDVTFILYTSGTTGTPKGAMLTHKNIIGDMIAIIVNLTSDENDIYMIPVPFSHCFGCELGITMAAITGAKMVPVKDQTPSVAINTAIKEGCTILHGTPTHFLRYINYVKENPGLDLSKLRTGVSAGALLPPRVAEDMINILHLPDFINAYGETEASPIMTMTTPWDPWDKRVYTVGRKIPSVEVKVVDDDNNEVGVGVAGEMCGRGWNIMKGYYNEPELTAEAIDEDGWLHTGDLGKVDEDGYYQIVGRKKDMIIYGGANVYPKIIEDFLLKHPKIIEVAVVGIPNEEYGEVVGCVAIVEKGFTEQDLVDYCYGKISDFSVPRYVYFDLQIPLSGRGKIQKYKLRDVLKQMAKDGKLGEPVVPTKVKEKQTIKAFKTVKPAPSFEKLPYNRELGKQIAEKYLKDSDLKLFANEHSLFDQAALTGEMAYSIAKNIVEKRKEFAEILDPELVGFLGYVHNIGYIIQREKHELHTVYILQHKENIPVDIAIKTKHGHLVEKYGDHEEYYPVGLEGMILTLIDIAARNGELIPIDEREKQIEKYLNESDFPEEQKKSFLENFKKAVPRYKKYEQILRILQE